MNQPTSAYLSIQDWVDDFRNRGGPRGMADELRQGGLEAGRIGLAGFNGTIQLTSFLKSGVESLEKELPNATFLDATQLLSYPRLIKSEEEIGGTHAVIGSYDAAAQEFKRLSDGGLDGMAIGLVNYIDDLPALRD